MNNDKLPLKLRGQATVGMNRDLQIQERSDGALCLVEVTYAQTDFATTRRFDQRLVLTPEGMREFAVLLYDYFAAIDKRSGAPSLPILRSEYASITHEPKGGGNV